MYDISFDEQNRVLTLRQSGFWNLNMVQRYIADVAAEADRVARRHGDFSILTDNSEFQVQSLDVMEAFMAFTQGAMERNRDRRVAIIVSSALAKMQVARISEGGNVRIFNDRAGAMQWLTENKSGDDHV